MALIVSLLAVQAWIVPFLVRQVTGAEWFRGSAEAGGDSVAVSNEWTHQAFLQCNKHLENQERGRTLVFPSTALKSWDIGFNRFMVQGSVDILENEGHAKHREYVCRIHYTGGDEADPGDWSVVGIEFTTP